MRLFVVLFGVCVCVRVAAACLFVFCFNVQLSSQRKNATFLWVSNFMLYTHSYPFDKTLYKQKKHDTICVFVHRIPQPLELLKAYNLDWYEEVVTPCFFFFFFRVSVDGSQRVRATIESLWIECLCRKFWCFQDFQVYGCWWNWLLNMCLTKTCVDSGCWQRLFQNWLLLALNKEPGTELTYLYLYFIAVSPINKKVPSMLKHADTRLPFRATLQDGKLSRRRNISGIRVPDDRILTYWLLRLSWMLLIQMLQMLYTMLRLWEQMFNMSTSLMCLPQYFCDISFHVISDLVNSKPYETPSNSTKNHQHFAHQMPIIIIICL